MVEVIKAEVPEALAKKFRKRAMEIHGYKKGAVKTALIGLLRRFVNSGKTDWGKLKGCIGGDRTSLELQHEIWRRID